MRASRVREGLALALRLGRPAAESNSGGFVSMVALTSADRAGDVQAAAGASGTRVDATIGRTPVVRLERVVEPGMAEVWVKLEGLNPGGSIKDRTALGMVLDAERRGWIAPGATIVEPTSGNTGIGLAQVASA